MNKVFLYEFSLTLEVGLVLEGVEVKLIRRNNPSLTGAYGFFVQGELFIKNLVIYKNFERYIKVLAHKNQLKRIFGLFTKEKSIIVPIDLYEKNGKFKLVIGVGKRKKEHDRRQEIKKRDLRKIGFD